MSEEFDIMELNIRRQDTQQHLTVKGPVYEQPTCRFVVLTQAGHGLYQPESCIGRGAAPVSSWHRGTQSGWWASAS